MKNLFDVCGRVIVITDGTGVFGHATGYHFSEQGAHVVVLDRNDTVG